MAWLYIANFFASCVRAFCCCISSLSPAMFGCVVDVDPIAALIGSKIMGFLPLIVKGGDSDAYLSLGE